MEKNASGQQLALEEVRVGSTILFQKRIDEARLFHDDGTAGPELLADRTHSSLYQIPDRDDTRKLTRFKRWVDHLFILHFERVTMDPLSEKAASNLLPDLSNFSSWARHLLNEKHPAVQQSVRDLAAAVGIEDIQSVDVGERNFQLLYLMLKDPTGQHGYFLSELSEGQRELIALYVLLRAVGSEDATICLDEPDAFLALPEIQPWLGLVEETSAQWLLISHHPEIINFWAPKRGLVFERAKGGSIAVKRFEASPDEPLTAAELFARG